LPAYLWGIETELTESQAKTINTHCQPTYEELKRRFLYSFSILISSLPAYLWGIET